MRLRSLVYILIIVNFILIGYLVEDYTGRVVYETEIANVTEIIDGDTLNTDLGKVRLLGINTPEKNRFGYEEAREFLLELEGKQVELIKSVEDRDRYDRLLRYVIYQDRNMNQEILEQGLGHIYIYDEDSFTEDLIVAESEAYEAEIGIWKRSQDTCAGCIKLVELNHVDPGEYVVLENSCDFSCNLQNWTIKDEATHLKVLNFSINSGEQYRIEYSGRVWNDAGDTLFLRDSSGKLVLRYGY